MKRVILVVLLAALCALPRAGASGRAANDTIIIRGLGNITTFNPILSQDGASLQASEVLWPAAFDLDNTTGQPIPGLTSWKVSDDGLTYTFTIRKDANWSDGTPITAQDMKFVIDAVKSDNVKSSLKGNAQYISSVKVVDDKTYQIVLTTPSCTALSDFYAFRFMPSFRFKPDFSDFETNAIDTNPDISGGPFILTDWKPDEYQHYKANPTYWKGPPKAAFLINKVLQDPTLMLQALQAGDVDYAYMQGDLFQQLTKKDSIQFKAFPQVTVSFMMLNWQDPTNPQSAYSSSGSPIQLVPNPIFSDVRVRKAFAMGYNKEDILKTLGGKDGGTVLLGAVIPTLTWAYNSDLQPYSYDPVQAGKLLDAAGWTMNTATGIREKNGQPLKFEIDYSDLINYFETTALVAQDQLKQIGMDVSIKKMEWATYLKDVYFGLKYDASPISNSGGGSADPNDFMSLLYSKNVVVGSASNPGGYVNPAVDKLIDQAKTVPGCSVDARGALYKQIQKLAYDDVAYDFTITPNLYQIASKRITGFNPGPLWSYYGYLDHVNEWGISQ